MDIKTQKSMLSALALSFMIGGGLWIGAYSGTAPSLDRSLGAADRSAVVQDKASAVSRAGKRSQRDALPYFEETALLLGIGTRELARRLRTKSAAEVVADAGYSPDAFIRKLLAPRLKKLEEAVATDRIPSDSAAQIRKRWDQLARSFLNRRPKSRQPLRPDWAQVAQSLGLDKAELVQHLRQGASITGTAASKGVNEEELRDGLRSRLEQAVGKWLEYRSIQSRDLPSP
ncbi:hypothetical protein ACFQWB_10725 [Paenibacillus thermoaerophilus]|uniref:Uncharacterized protein n=1 Tax=Paenibacillus thermoaerophilus TaxID=1215385 RepID=A0ABW2V6J6_9BACL|nr:hypothetical protein [Paenibacillus thermoaerophilus]TMV18760.1 hypothetical protein FE781_02170 [Paenibacillus thermoaerophilus]